MSTSVIIRTALGLSAMVISESLDILFFMVDREKAAGYKRVADRSQKERQQRDQGGRWLVGVLVYAIGYFVMMSAYANGIWTTTANTFDIMQPTPKGWVLGLITAGIPISAFSIIYLRAQIAGRDVERRALFFIGSAVLVVVFLTFWGLAVALLYMATDGLSSVFALLGIIGPVFEVVCFFTGHRAKFDLVMTVSTVLRLAIVAGFFFFGYAICNIL